MGKYAKRTVVPKPSVKSGPKVKSSKQRKPAAKTAKAKAARRRQKGAAGKEASGAAEASTGNADVAAMSDAADAGRAPESACVKIMGFLSKAKTEAKLMDAVKKITRTHMDPDSLGAALLHAAGRGHAPAVEWLLAASAPMNYSDPRESSGPRTPLQLAASRGHVNACRLLVGAGADRAGAFEAAQVLTQYGAVFMEERKAIQAMLK
mmetsp:Transcript_63459/g.151360  ORF Transcript_63459/g.151360 Transcript_63459/m.151360 type:complete len:207 (-) Transcript_63459:60-680(-)